MGLVRAKKILCTVASSNDKPSYNKIYTATITITDDDGTLQ